MTELDFALRVAAGTLCGIIVGFERARVRKITGMRTLGIVALGGALLVAAFEHAVPGNPDASSRVVQGLLAGFGFLGAGVILRGTRAKQARGITTAASMWLAAILGIVAGMGEIAAALIAAVAAFLMLLAGDRVDRGVGRARAARAAPRDRGPPPPDPRDGG